MPTPAVAPVAPHDPSPSVCPDCAAVLEADERFPVWCPACEWNLQPAEPVRELTPKQRRRAERAERRAKAGKRKFQARVEGLFDALLNGDAAAVGRDWLLAATLAGAVHLVSLTVLGGSTALLLFGTWPLRAVAVCCLGLGFLLRPRFGRIRPDETYLTRAEAPALYALADRVAAAVGARPVDHIRADGRFNASFRRAGLRRRSVLSIGLPLWSTLTPSQRVAVLGHEFGHDVNGDHRRGIWLNWALTALEEWHLIIQPTSFLARLLLAAPKWLTGRLLELMDRLTVRSGQAAEYRADELSARVTSVETARQTLEALLLRPSAETVQLRYRSLPRQRSGPNAGRPEADLWAELGALAGSLTPLERERRLRLSVREAGAVDSTHPPTHLRIKLIGRRPVDAHPVLFGAAEQAAVEAELAPARDRLVRELLPG
ncbi:Zn-dependent protease with chaperone function [Kitasatospora gansuensis]|uniref:Zn-dependent protease with chaperone function n=1 Tax=Kitasatospora gansuensis TaxID=258050 RepID=A0A7W7WKN5_9ACTN|nr:M48 family metallopeptidase [Kitasatospora gansuensis]MBB4950383.1 Zn-dependent protease with chaperone function [Kitasatospora gansuensis]